LESPFVAEVNMNEKRPSLIETLRSDSSGIIPLLSRHLRRLHTSAQQLYYACPLESIQKKLLETADKYYQGTEGRLRLLLHKNGKFELHHQPLPVFCQSAYPPYIALAQPCLHIPNVWLQHKTTFRPDYEKARYWLQSQTHYFDCVFLNQYEQVCEGSRSTIYVQLDGHWYTPPLSCGVLPGIMREVLLESGQVRERILTKNDVLHASAWRISNALYGWQDVLVDRERLALQ